MTVQKECKCILGKDNTCALYSTIVNWSINLQQQAPHEEKGFWILFPNW